MSKTWTSASVLILALLLGTPTLSPHPAGAAPLPESDGYRGIWYGNTPLKNEYRFKYSGGMPTYPQQHVPIAVYRKEVNRTFFVFGGTTDPTNAKPQLVTLVSYYDHATGTVPRPRVLLERHTEDAHDNATLCIDDKGYLFVFCNSHGTTRRSSIFRSAKPYAIDEFERVWQGNFSYGQPWFIPGEGFLLLHTHYEAGGEHRLFWMTSDDGRTWSDRQTLSMMPKGQYQVSWPDPRDRRRIATAFDFHPGGLDHRTNLYYLETSDRGRTWRTADGTAVKVPLADPANPARVHDYQSEKLNVYLKDLQFDGDGRPIVLYLTSKGAEPGPQNGPYEWYTARWNGKSWDLRPMTTSDHNYDHGSLYVSADGTWTVIAPTDPGPQPFGAGGEMVVWASKDQGATWARVRALTHDSPRNHTYLRRPLDAREEFWGIWADGDARHPSESDLFFTTRAAEQAWRLPRKMTAETAKPELVP